MRANYTASKLKRQHVIGTKNPHPKSYAAFIKYKTWLANLENTILHSKWMEFRYNYLAEQQKEGPLTCSYCGKSGLVIYSADDHAMATVDHVRPISKGGGVFDKDNLTVSCYTCNQQKGSKSPEEWEARPKPRDPKKVLAGVPTFQPMKSIGEHRPTLVQIKETV